VGGLLLRRWRREGVDWSTQSGLWGVLFVGARDIGDALVAVGEEIISLAGGSAAMKEIVAELKNLI
jgi:hypothetical protein